MYFYPDLTQPASLATIFPDLDVAGWGRDWFADCGVRACLAIRLSRWAAFHGPLVVLSGVGMEWRSDCVRGLAGGYSR
jgi:hypothetical protein